MKKEGKFVDLEFKDNFLVARYKAGPKIDLSAAKIILSERIEFTNNTSYPVLVIDSGLVSMDKQARDFLSSNEAIEGIRASAIISSSVVNSMLVNFILKISRPNLPVRVFTDRKTAETWLNSFVDEEKSNE